MSQLGLPPPAPCPYRRPDRQAQRQAAGRRIPDRLAPRLPLLLVGINPSLYSAAVGHHFARPGNRFWPALAAAGLTPRLLQPWEDELLPRCGIGLTNVVARATARADELRAEELQRGGRTLVRKLRRWKPRSVAFLGITAYRSAFREPSAAMGRQPAPLAGCTLWVLPNPSGLNAHYQLPDIAGWLARAAERGERPQAAT